MFQTITIALMVQDFNNTSIGNNPSNDQFANNNPPPAQDDDDLDVPAFARKVS